MSDKPVRVALSSKENRMVTQMAKYAEVTEDIVIKRAIRLMYVYWLGKQG